MRSLNHRSHTLAKVSDAEVLTVAVVARYFRNNHERALWVLAECGHCAAKREKFFDGNASVLIS